MRSYKVSPTLKEALANVLTRRGIYYEFTESDEQIYCETPISGQLFHKCVIRAKMEKLQEEKNSLIPYVASVEVDDPLVMREVGSAFFVQ